ncbi:MAG: hypothetical protein WBR26_12580 [Candidatus Acidiferrum sp.]
MHVIRSNLNADMTIHTAQAQSGIVCRILRIQHCFTAALAKLLSCSRASEEMQKQRNDRNEQQQVNQSSGNVEQQEAANPQNKKKYRDDQKRSESHRSPL